MTDLQEALKDAEHDLEMGRFQDALLIAWWISRQGWFVDVVVIVVVDADVAVDVVVDAGACCFSPALQNMHQNYSYKRACFLQFQVWYFAIFLNVSESSLLRLD